MTADGRTFSRLLEDSPDRMRFGRRLLIACLVHSGCLAYACLLGLLLSSSPPLADCFRAGSYAGLVLAPRMSFFVLRSLNLTVARPADNDRWWIRANGLVLRAFGIFLVCGALRSETDAGLVFGSLAGLVLAAAPGPHAAFSPSISGARNLTELSCALRAGLTIPP